LGKILRKSYEVSKIGPLFGIALHLLAFLYNTANTTNHKRKQKNNFVKQSHFNAECRQIFGHWCFTKHSTGELTRLADFFAWSEGWEWARGGLEIEQKENGRKES